MPKFKKSDLIIIAVLVLLSGCLGGGIYYNSGQIAMMTAKRQAKEAELQKIKEKVLNFNQLQEEVAQNEAAMQRLADYIPDREGQAEFIMELDALTDSSGVQLKSCSVNEQPLPFPNLPEYLIYRWNVNLQSNYTQLMRFLEILPLQKRSVMVSKININSVQPDAKTETNARYSLNVQLTLDLIATAGQKKVVQ
ncbi:MAG TPA: type 4a pilus biogenesis protein PilO [Bacillota bacterium]